MPKEIKIPFGLLEKVRAPQDSEHVGHNGFIIDGEFVPDWRVILINISCAGCGCQLPNRRADFPCANLCDSCFAHRVGVLTDAIAGSGAEHTARVAAEVVNGGGIGNLRKAVKRG